ncbi:Wadjet anti-phage system protein JetD domain-containing protein [Pseudarthrobacter oxydans]|uniref:Wadjet anti-phage system protein JetD domain-containing protein n=1 Tax=Pseudarthrobacter oxydans TaxID=1671 RepID=UPI002AA962E3|nr:Wadjet anti-phage system protein JetD domain-containing protein [Pseudarthrobacter oxydans]WPU11039.1 DUF2220 family protein [Pseudarthrobacter oxydans]
MARDVASTESSNKWVSVDAARSAAAAKYERNFGDWAVGAANAIVDVPLHPPTEAAALADQAKAIAWVKSWREAGISRAGRSDFVVWVERRWASLGTQQVPERLRLEGAPAVAAFARKGQHWARIRQRAQALVSSFGVGEVLADCVRRNAGAVSELAEQDFDRLLLVLQWLERNPDSGLYIRQLPVRGVDTKWVSKHRRLVERLFSAITGRESFGLAKPPVLVRVRFLDPALSPDGLVDVSVPVAELAAMELSPQTVFVFENLESVVAMPPVPGAVVIHGSGYAVDRLGRIPWVREGRVVYWGDLDSHGFGILNRVRATCGDVSTALMDLATLADFEDLWVNEPSPNPGSLNHLLPADLAVLDELRMQGNIRLEQERISWGYALQKLLKVARL